MRISRVRLDCLKEGCVRVIYAQMRHQVRACARIPFATRIVDASIITANAEAGLDSRPFCVSDCRFASQRHPRRYMHMILPDSAASRNTKGHGRARLHVHGERTRHSFGRGKTDTCARFFFRAPLLPALCATGTPASLCARPPIAGEAVIMARDRAVLPTCPIPQ